MHASELLAALAASTALTAQGAGIPPGGSVGNGLETCLVYGEAKIAEGVGGFAGPSESGAGFGSGVAELGDLDGEGREDLLVGAPGDDDAATTMVRSGCSSSKGASVKCRPFSNAPRSLSSNAGTPEAPSWNTT